MVRRYNPLKLDGSDALLKPLSIIISGYKKWDKPVEKKQPVGIDIPELLCTMGQLSFATTQDSVLGDWVLIAFYYLLRIGEYTQKSSRQETKQTVEFRVMDVTFFGKGHDVIYDVMCTMKHVFTLLRPVVDTGQVFVQSLIYHHQIKYYQNK